MVKDDTLAEIMLLSEIRISAGISAQAQSSPPYWSVRWLSSKLRAMSRTYCGACKKTDILKEKVVAGNP